MKIALIGYGKMGKTIEQLALAKGHKIGLVIDINNKEEFTASNLQKIDVAIEFSSPESAFENISTCLNNGTPVISGTTGWLDKIEEIKSLCERQKGAFFYASNYSVGVNIFFEINRQLAKMMDRFPAYQVVMEEIHHTQKLDAPIISKRIDNVPGTHSVSYESRIDNIEIKHTAHSRVGFAEGSIKAAEWIIGKQGCFGMKDMLGF
jgi:4-hydroxy-tetrahydrodipicolinate reductase